VSLESTDWQTNKY